MIRAQGGDPDAPLPDGPGLARRERAGRRGAHPAGRDGRRRRRLAARRRPGPQGGPGAGRRRSRAARQPGRPGQGRRAADDAAHRRRRSGSTAPWPRWTAATTSVGPTPSSSRRRSSSTGSPDVPSRECRRSTPDGRVDIGVALSQTIRTLEATMPELIDPPTRIPIPGGKLIDEYVGRVRTQTDAVQRGPHDRAGRLGGAGSDPRLRRGDRRAARRRARGARRRCSGCPAWPGSPHQSRRAGPLPDTGARRRCVRRGLLACVRPAAAPRPD